jgi:hypothetical protein
MILVHAVLMVREHINDTALGDAPFGATLDHALDLHL